MAGASAKGVLLPFHLIIATSMTGTITSVPTNVQYIDDIYYQLQWTGTPNGTFAIQTSADYIVGTGGTVLNAGTWLPLTLSATITALGSADQARIDLNQLPDPWVRLVYTPSSSTGTLDVYIGGKAL